MAIGCTPEKTAHRAPDVEFAPSEDVAVDAMLAIARVGPKDVVYDLGSGDGRIVIAAAKRFGARGVGIEIDPNLVAVSRRNAVDAGVEKLVDFREGNLFEADIREATVVMLYLLPELNLRLRPKLLAGLAPGARVVSHEFDMGDWRPDTTVIAGYSTVHRWTIRSRARASGGQPPP